MSKDSTNRPDDYESIFDESLSVENKGESTSSDLTMDVADSIDTQSASVENELEMDVSPPKEGDDFIDADIEDGIFAPERKVIKPAKKSTNLMVTVSILAVIGVAGFVYISNPDMVSNVTNNLSDQSEIILPQDNLTETTNVVVADSGTAEVGNDKDGQGDLVLPQTENDGEEKEQAESSESLKTVTAEVTPVTPVTPVDPVPAIPDSVIEPPKDMVSEPIQQVQPPEVNVDVQPAVIPEEKNVVVASVPEPDTTTIAAPPVSIPSAEDKEANKEPQNIVVDAPSKEESKAPEVIQDIKVEETKIEDEKIIVKNSKEEQKVIDDAKLDSYFDSPNGKMLKDIPAPSMDPRKGSGESIIIVNKKGNSSVVPKSVEIETTDLSRQTIAANRALKLERYEAAKEMYDGLYRLNPKDESILSGRALVFQKMGMKDQAVSAYEQLLKLYPDNVDAIVNLAGIIRKEYPAVALNKLLDLREKYPNNVFVIAQLGVTYSDAGNYEDAIHNLTLATQMDSKNALHFYNLAVVLEKASKPQDALKIYERALEVDSIFSEGKKMVPREKIYDRLAFLRRS